MQGIRRIPLVRTVGRPVRRLGRNVWRGFRILRHNIPYWVKGAPDGLPIPPLGLIRVTWPLAVDLSIYFGETVETAEGLLGTLARHGVDTSKLNAILDFGCGTGRVIRQFRVLGPSLGPVRLVGVDINARQMAWCRRHLPFAEFAVNQPDLPLPYPDGTFDFAYSCSVLSYLTEPQQVAWARELRRVLKPGGHCWFSTRGAGYLSSLTESERAQFQAGQLVVSKPEFAGSPNNYFLTGVYHPVAYVRDTLAQGFDVVEHIAGKPLPAIDQDQYLLRKRA